MSIDVGSDYDANAKILLAIRNRLVSNIWDNEISNANLITKKEGTNDVISISLYVFGQQDFFYEIKISEDKFTLKLLKNKNKIEKIQNHLKFINNFIFLLLKDNTHYAYNTNAKILKIIRKKLFNGILGIQISDANLITKKVGKDEVTSITDYDEAITSYIIIICKENFKIKLNQKKYTKKEAINIIKIHLKYTNNLNLKLSKTINSNYNEDKKILNAIRKKLVELIDGIEIGCDSWITKKQGEKKVL